MRRDPAPIRRPVQPGCRWWVGALWIVLFAGSLIGMAVTGAAGQGQAVAWGVAAVVCAIAIAQHAVLTRAAGAARAGSVILALAEALAVHSGETAMHVTEVEDLAERVAREMGLDHEAAREVRAVAALHDVGKLCVPREMLLAPRSLTPDEWALVRRHPDEGARITARVPELRHLAPAVRACHERWDGAGYPQGLSGAQIPLPARVVFCADAWCAMREDRPYAPAVAAEEAEAEIGRCAGTQFDPGVAQALLRVVTTETARVGHRRSLPRPVAVAAAEAAATADHTPAGGGA